jgi:hypothetical protein
MTSYISLKLYVVCGKLAMTLSSTPDFFVEYNLCVLTLLFDAQLYIPVTMNQLIWFE